ncbi:hypothetical protein CRENBAI_019293 [Crenichthys baileyi]|uniref:Secreted protein n=1 Tax=Crenichthys baileyi TaxID=28760 RepID=A0AAV9R3J4_9TELE
MFRTHLIISPSFHSCFLSLLLVAAVVWKIKQSCWASRRRECPRRNDSPGQKVVRKAAKSGTGGAAGVSA